MSIIIILVVVGILLLVAELILLPGISVAGICALISFGGAIYLGFDRYGTTGGVLVISGIVVLAVVATVISLRSRTWRKFALKDSIDGTSQQLPSDQINVGDRGIAVTRLAPLGKIEIDGRTYEARSVGDVYVDPRTEVEVVDFENFTAIVKIIGI